VSEQKRSGLLGEPRIARQDGSRRDEALRAAMESVLNDRVKEEFAHPRAWAGFIIVGDVGD
jgi:CHAT domain-containing protein